MAYTHTRPIVPHTRPALVTIYEGEGKTRRAVHTVRAGSWGPLPNDCAIIEAYKAGNRPVGPYTVDHIPDSKGGIWKIFRNDNFRRYADGEDIRKLSELVRQGHDGLIEEFVTLPPVLIFGEYTEDSLDGAFGPPTTKPTPARPAKKGRALPSPADDLDDAFAPPGHMKAVPPKRNTAGDDPLDGAFGEQAPTENTLAAWADIILTRDEDDPFGVFGDDLDEAFS